MVPEGWAKTTLGEHVRIHSGFAPASLNLSEDGNVPYVKVEDMNNCSRIQLTSRESALHDGRVLPINTVIFPKRGAAILNNKVRITGAEIILDTNMMGLEALDTLDPWFAYYRLVFEKLFKIADTSTIPQINNKHINPYRLPLPPLPEQRKIADILSTWDRAIETTEALLATARTQKRALMQSLLTGKRRFPEFEGQAWKEVRLGDVVEIITGKSKRDVLDADGDKIVLDMGSVSRSGTVIPKKRTFATEDLLDVGDLVMPKDDIGGGNIIGKVVLVSHEDAFVLGDHVYRLRTKSKQPVVPSFLRFVINGPEVNRWFRRKANGTAQLGLNRRDVEKQIIMLPPTEEQSQIAGILSEAEDLEAQYEAQIEKLRTEKKALMQQLLTGKRRVVVE